jgi:mono/diheme cytochrome c family protein
MTIAPRTTFAMTLSFFAFLSAADFRAARADDTDQGREVYHELCASCHGRDMVNTGTISPDLRQFPKDDLARFKNAVLNGKGRAMPAWADKVSDEDLTNLWAYVRSGG